MSRSPFDAETVRRLDLIFQFGWTHHPDAMGIFEMLGHPYAHVLADERDEFVEFLVLVVYMDGSAAISGLLTDRAAPVRVDAVKALAEIARGRGVERVMVADVPARTRSRLLPACG